MDDADNILGIFYQNKPLRRKANSYDRAEMKGAKGVEDEGEAGKQKNPNDNDKSKLNEESVDDLYEEGPSVEWLPSSGSEGEAADKVDNLASLRDKDGRIVDNSEILNMTGVRDLK